MSGAGGRHPAPLPAEDHRCHLCELDYAELAIPRARQILAAVPDAAAAALDAVPAGRLRLAPDPGTWSPVEYLCHLRDVAVTSTIRLHRARTEDRPVVEPMLNDLRARRFRYVEADPAAVLAELGHTTAGLLDEIARVAEDGWDRTVTRLPGEVRTARWLVRHAAHEGRHHVADLRRAGTIDSVVRPRVAADVAVLAAILRDLHAREGYPMLEHRDLGAWLCRAPQHAAWVAERAGWAIGHVALVPPGRRDVAPTLVAEPAAVITRLFVARDARGQALGERLVRAATRAAADRGCRAVLDVLVSDLAATALYERLGWQRIGTATSVIGGTGYPAICFAAPS